MCCEETRPLLGFLEGRKKSGLAFGKTGGSNEIMLFINWLNNLIALNGALNDLADFLQ